MSSNFFFYFPHSLCRKYIVWLKLDTHFHDGWTTSTFSIGRPFLILMSINFSYLSKVSLKEVPIPPRSGKYYNINTNVIHVIYCTQCTQCHCRPTTNCKSWRLCRTRDWVVHLTWDWHLITIPTRKDHHLQSRRLSMDVLVPSKFRSIINY